MMDETPEQTPDEWKLARIKQVWAGLTPTYRLVIYNCAVSLYEGIHPEEKQQQPAKIIPIRAGEIR